MTGSWRAGGGGWWWWWIFPNNDATVLRGRQKVILVFWNYSDFTPLRHLTISRLSRLLDHICDIKYHNTKLSPKTLRTFSKIECKNKKKCPLVSSSAGFSWLLVKKWGNEHLEFPPFGLDLEVSSSLRTPQYEFTPNSPSLYFS